MYWVVRECGLSLQDLDNVGWKFVAFGTWKSCISTYWQVCRTGRQT